MAAGRTHRSPPDTSPSRPSRSQRELVRAIGKGILDRRQLNLAILAAALWPAAGQTRDAGTRAVFEFAVAGGWHHGLEAVAGLLRPGERLALEPEPRNPHDRFAVAVRRGDLKLGYVPREASERVSTLLSAGRTLVVEVVGPLHPRPDQSDIADLVFTSFTEGDPRLRLLDEG